ncbi:MAG: hypothetical protein ABSG97_06295 [Sedimentisphaerales bacterium]
MKSKSTCRLCHTSSLLKESHIVTKSIFNLLRDKTINNRFYEIGGGTENIVQDGPKEYLLCDKCEQKIGRYEKYFKEAVHLGRHGIKIIQGKNIAIIRNLDYKKVKLYLLSLLWRMSISSLPQFADVSLANNEDVIRKRILEEKPGESCEYQIAAIIPLINGKIEEGWMFFPIISTHPHETVYYMIVGGILYSISMTQQDKCFHKYLLYESGNWAMPLIDFYKIPFIKDFVDSNFGENDLPPKN